MHRSLALIVGVVFSGSTFGQGAIQKCLGADGKIAYQDAPCDVGHKTTQIQRNRTTADPLSMQRAQDDRERVDGFAKTRAKQNAADDLSRARADEAEAKAQALAATEEREDARARMIANSVGGYVPLQPIIIKERIIIENRSAPRAPAPAPKPAPTFSGPVPKKQ